MKHTSNTSLLVCTVDRISFYVGLNFLAMCALIMAMGMHAQEDAVGHGSNGVNVDLAA